MTQQDMTAYQTTQLADLDKQLAVWGQRMQVLDQQINSVQQTINESVLQLGGQMTNLAEASDAWLLQASQDSSTPAELLGKVTALKTEIVKIGEITVNTDVTNLQVIADDLQAVSAGLLQNLTTQADTFGAALDQAATDLSTHYGIQI